MKQIKRFGWIMALVLIVAACGGATDGEETSTTAEGATATTDAATATTAQRGDAGQGGEILLLQWQAPSQANPYLSTGEKDLLASSPVLEPLAEVAPDGSIVPNLAESVPTKGDGSIAGDDTSITWTLKEGISWSDGSPLTADDFVFTWEYCADPGTGCSQDMSTVESVEAADDRTVVVNFNSPQPYPFGIFTTFQQPVIQRAQFEDCVGAAAVTCTDQNFAPIGTGPYMVTELKPEDTVSYELNPNYRGIPEGKPFFGSVTIKGGGDAESAARSVLEIGEADYAWNLQVAPEILGPMESAGNGVVKVGFTADVEHINLNQTDPNADPRAEFVGDPLAPDGGEHPVFYQNGDLARALSMAINRDELVAVGYGAAGSPTCTIWPVPGEATTNQDWCLNQDIDGANAMLDELGYLDMDGDGTRETPDGIPLEFEYVTSINAVRQSNQELIKSYWREIGVSVEMSSQDAGLFFDGTCASDFCIWKFFTDIEMFTNGA
ncbi:MAG: peptide ABC transporter substrate-binding protein [Acidimicrobiia bacterium]